MRGKRRIFFGANVTNHALAPYTFISLTQTKRKLVMSAVSAIGGAAALTANHSKAPSATQSLQQIQQQAIAAHQAETRDVSKSGVNIKA